MLTTTTLVYPACSLYFILVFQDSKIHLKFSRKQFLGLGCVFRQRRRLIVQRFGIQIKTLCEITIHVKIRTYYCYNQLRFRKSLRNNDHRYPARSVNKESLEIVALVDDKTLEFCWAGCSKPRLTLMPSLVLKIINYHFISLFLSFIQTSVVKLADQRLSSFDQTGPRVCLLKNKRSGTCS